MLAGADIEALKEIRKQREFWETNLLEVLEGMDERRIVREKGGFAGIKR